MRCEILRNNCSTDTNFMAKLRTSATSGDFTVINFATRRDSACIASIRFRRRLINKSIAFGTYSDVTRVSSSWSQGITDQLSFALFLDPVETRFNRVSTNQFI